jgi:KDO2-lipid IV(A) lauroyltransferase
MKLRKRLRQGPEALLALTGWLIIPWLPRAAVVWLSRFLGGIAWACSPHLRRIAMANLELAFGESMSPARRQEIGKASCQSFALMLLDVFWFMRRTASRQSRYFQYDASFLRFINESPFIAVAGHIGNWELQSTVCGALGAPVTAVAMPLRNPFVDRILNRMRSQTGCMPVPRRGAVRSLLKSLKAGRTIALVLDQNTLPKEGGLFVPFFGLPVPVSNAAALLWQRTGVSLMALCCVADREGVYHVTVNPPFPSPGEDLTVDALTLRATQELEAMIRLHPEHWLWSYKRWHYYRPEDPAQRYPFYARLYKG